VSHRLIYGIAHLADRAMFNTWNSKFKMSFAEALTFAVYNNGIPSDQHNEEPFVKKFGQNCLKNSA
jgi:hypothetical protein